MKGKLDNTRGGNMPEQSSIDVVDAAKRIPMRHGTLRQWLARHAREFPARYRRGRHRQRVRVLTETEVRIITARVQEVRL
jgi:hypothetical protein